jgi:hypothetical protein
MWENWVVTPTATLAADSAVGSAVGTAADSAAAVGVATAVAEAIAALGRIPTEVLLYRGLDDSTLLELMRLSAVERQLVDAHASVLAGEVARRSAPELGYAGLAQRSGHRTPAELVRVTTKATLREAVSAVRVGQLVHDANPVADFATGERPAPVEPWLAPVSAAVVAGALSVAAADAIRTGLGRPADGVTPALLRDAATHLCTTALAMDPDRLLRAARQMRDELNAAGIADREAHRHQQRSLRFFRQVDGMSRLIWLLDPESAATVADLYDRATSPRRGGPRFTSQEELAQSIVDDPRSTEQLASDVFLDLLRAGADADSTQLLGSGAPAIRVLVTAEDLTAGTRQGTGQGTGQGRIEGQHDPVSIETVERLTCTGGTTVITVSGDGQPLNLGREQRLFTRHQKIALATRDGGCVFPDCERPPSWTEAHHINHWRRDHGKTDLEDGVLLCRHHHLLVHNNHWEIQRHHTSYTLIPPRDIDPRQKPIPLHTKNKVLQALMLRSIAQ